MERAAADFLAQHGIDEPATWQPPLTLLDDLDLPGPDASSVDVVQLHTLVRTGAALGQAAEGLGTTLGAVRLILSESPAPPVHQTLTQAQARALGGTRRSARRRLPTEDLAHLLQQGWSLKAIGRKYQLNRATVGTLAREYQLAPRRGGRLPRHQVNKEWLAEQYLQRRRTLTDLAAEIGISVTHMSRITRQFGIVTRPRGAPSQQATQDVLNQAEQAPPILRLTLTGRWAWQRLDRFAEATQHATLTAAAAALGVERHTLVGQIKQLERQLQGPLFRRAHRGRPMKLTHLGHQLLAAVSEMQTGRAVAAEIGTRSLL